MSSEQGVTNNQDQAKLIETIQQEDQHQTQNESERHNQDIPQNAQAESRIIQRQENQGNPTPLSNNQRVPEEERLNIQPQNTEEVLRDDPALTSQVRPQVTFEHMDSLWDLVEFVNRRFNEVIVMMITNSIKDPLLFINIILKFYFRYLFIFPRQWSQYSLYYMGLQITYQIMKFMQDYIIFQYSQQYYYTYMFGFTHINI